LCYNSSVLESLEVLFSCNQMLMCWSLVLFHRWQVICSSVWLVLQTVLHFFSWLSQATSPFLSKAVSALREPERSSWLFCDPKVLGAPLLPTNSPHSHLD
jgi:hypothetical protein